MSDYFTDPEQPIIPREFWGEDLEGVMDRYRKYPEDGELILVKSEDNLRLAFCRHIYDGRDKAWSLVLKYLS